LQSAANSPLLYNIFFMTTFLDYGVTTYFIMTLFGYFVKSE